MKKTIYFFSATHWDREWYQPFQGFRLRLVKLLDELITYLEETPEFEVFHLDGQTIVLEDYLEIRPENRECLSALIRQGRIVIGPWYCMPDEFSVSGEALIRNFQIGISLCEAFGTKPWRIGYACDIFGHIAQFPQILKKLGMKGAVVGRGTNQETFPAFFLWQSPDGSMIPAFKLQDCSGYAAFSDVVGRRAQGKELPADHEDFTPKVKAYIDEEFTRTDLPYCVIMDSMDHEPLHPMTLDYLKRIRELYPDCEILHTNLEHLFDNLEGKELPIRTGELFEPGKTFKGGYLYVIPHARSCRSELKRRNDYCQALLEKWLEPMLVFWRQHGITYPNNYLKIAWKWLLQNQSHDSISGFSCDRVHDDMSYRFSQAESIVEEISDDAERLLANGYYRCDATADKLCILNPTAYDYYGAVEVTIPFVPDYPKYTEANSSEKINAFRIIGEDGAEVPYVIKEIYSNTTVRPYSDKTFPTDLYTVILETRLNAFGITALRIVPDEKPIRYYGTLVLSNIGLDNGLVRVTVNDDGTINLLDNETGRQYNNLLNLIDDGDIGVGSHSVQPKNDIVITKGHMTQCAVTVSSPVYSELKIRREILIPQGTQRTVNGFRRSREEKVLTVDMFVGLAKSAKKVDVRLEYINEAENHRLRLALPTYSDTDKYVTNTAYGFIERKSGWDIRTAQWREADVPEKPTNGIVAVRNSDQCGIAFIGQYGFHECSMTDDQAHTVYLTLHRSFGAVHLGNHLITSQEKGEHKRCFSLMLLSEQTDNLALQREQDWLQAPIRSFITLNPVSTSSLIKVTGGVVSAIKPALDESGDTVLRVYNPTSNPLSTEINISFDVSEAYFCDLMEQWLDPVSINGQKIEFELSPFEIKSIRLAK